MPPAYTTPMATVSIPTWPMRPHPPTRMAIPAITVRRMPRSPRIACSVATAWRILRRAKTRSRTARISMFASVEPKRSPTPMSGTPGKAALTSGGGPRRPRRRGEPREAQPPGRDPLIGEHPAPHPAEQAAPVATIEEEHGEVVDLPRLDERECLEELVHGAEAAGEDHEGLAVFHEHGLPPGLLPRDGGAVEEQLVLRGGAVTPATAHADRARR